jgi:hypothetical protein
MTLFVLSPTVGDRPGQHQVRQKVGPRSVRGSLGGHLEQHDASRRQDPENRYVPGPTSFLDVQQLIMHHLCNRYRVCKFNIFIIQLHVKSLHTCAIKRIQGWFLFGQMFGPKWPKGFLGGDGAGGGGQ